MLRTQATLVSCAAALAGCLGCGSGPADVDGTADPAPAMAEPAASLGDTVALRIGETVTLEGGAKVTYVRLVADSRCPLGVTCVWEGDAEVRIRIDVEGSLADTSLHTALEPRLVPVGPHILELLDVLPRPTEEPVADPPEPHVVLRLMSPE